MAHDAGSSAAARRAAPGSTPDFEVSERYRLYVVWLLFTIYVFNFVDRSILSILVQPIKHEFGFSDTQIGLLGGLAFAVLYSTLGLPIARLADRGSRVNIIALSLLAWSLFTAATGLARNFVQLLLARIAVGVGEAGCSPPAYSLISDYFDSKRRSSALAIYSSGIYGGVFLGLLVSALVAQRFGWRAAFFCVGLPGVVLAAVVKLTLREPPRGLADGVAAAVAEQPELPPVGSVLRTLWGKRAFRHLSAAAALSAFAGYGIGAFYPAFLMRSHGLSMVEVGAKLGLVIAVGGFAGTFTGGRLADTFSNRRDDMRYQLWIPALAFVIGFPIALAVYAVDGTNAVFALILIALVLASMYLGPTYATAQRLLTPRERALGSALLLFIINMIGLGLGPLTAGVLSDAFRAHLLRTGQSDPAATAGGLVWALRALTCIHLWSAVHFVLAARTLRQDVVN